VPVGISASSTGKPRAHGNRRVNSELICQCLTITGWKFGRFWTGWFRYAEGAGEGMTRSKEMTVLLTGAVQQVKLNETFYLL
jgi:hypothetical protein